MKNEFALSLKLDHFATMKNSGNKSDAEILCQKTEERIETSEERYRSLYEDSRSSRQIDFSEQKSG